MNQIVALIQSKTEETDFAALGVDQRAELLLALLRESDPRLAVGKTAADLSRPESSIAQSSLFTGASHEPQLYAELKKEIASADRIDMLVSFIKWSGLRLLMDELREFTENGGELMSTDELAVMDGGKCILQVQGVRPFFSDKFDITKHPQYKYLLDYSKKNYFDVAKFLSRRLTVRTDDVFECYEMEAPSSGVSSS